MPRTPVNRSARHSAALGKSGLVRDQVDRATHLADEAMALPNQLRYRFDIALAKGTGPVLLLLSAVTFGVVLLTALILTVVHATFVEGSGRGFFEIFWQTGLRALDPGTMAGDEGWAVRILSLFVTLSGILIAGTLIGTIATGIELRLENLRKGRSLVAETNHFLVLGWTERGFVVVDQLALVNSMKMNPGNIVVLSQEPKVELEDAIRSRVDLRGVRLAVRKGDSSSALDLARVNVQGARSVVVLGDDEPGDAQVITTILAVKARRQGLPIVPLVADLTEPDTPPAIERGFRGEVNTVMASRIVARLAAFSLREPGMSQVMLELMNFAGSDLYIRSVEGTVGKRYGELVTGFENATIIGVMKPDGTPELNPASEYLVEATDRPIIIAPTSSHLRFVPGEALSRSTSVPLEPQYNRNEHVLIMGWSRLGESMLEELDKFVSPTSTATVMYNHRILDSDDLEYPETLNLNVNFLPSGNKSGDVARLISENDYTSVVILAYAGILSPQRADARSLLSLLLVKEELEKSVKSHRPSVVVELLDSTNVELAALSGADDYVVSDALASQVISQLAENPDRQKVFEHLYAPKRATVIFRTAARLGLEGDVTFAEIKAALFSVGACALGWRQSSVGDLDVFLNPTAHDIIHLDPRDEIIAIV